MTPTQAYDELRYIIDHDARFGLKPPLHAEIRALLSEIERLRARDRQAIEIIRPFAKYSEATDPGEWAHDSGEIGEQIVGAFRHSIKLGHLRAARAFLNDRTSKEGDQ